MTQVASQELGQLKLQKQAEDLANNNQLADLDTKLNEMSLSKNYMFDSSIFTNIKPEEFIGKYNKFELVQDKTTSQYYFDLGDDLVMRPMRRDDYGRNYLGMLSQLTKIGDISQEQFEKRFDQMQACMGTYYTFVIVDVAKDKIAGLVNLFIS